MWCPGPGGTGGRGLHLIKVRGGAPLRWLRCGHGAARWGPHLGAVCAVALTLIPHTATHELDGGVSLHLDAGTELRGRRGRRPGRVGKIILWRKDEWPGLWCRMQARGSSRVQGGQGVRGGRILRSLLRGRPLHMLILEVRLIKFLLLDGTLVE